jgi:hypothetical protein
MSTSFYWTSSDGTVYRVAVRTSRGAGKGTALTVQPVWLEPDAQLVSEYGDVFTMGQLQEEAADIEMSDRVATPEPDPVEEH